MKKLYVILLVAFAFARVTQTNAEETYKKGEVIVQLNQDIPTTDVTGKNLNIASLDALGAKWGIIEWKRLIPKADKRFPNISKMLLLKFPETVDVGNVCQDYKNDPAIAVASLNYKIIFYGTPNDIYWSQQWDMMSDRVNLPAAWDLAYNLPPQGGDVIIGILDSGVDTNHIDLRNNLWLNPGETGIDEAGDDKNNNLIDDDENDYIDDVRGWNFKENNNLVFNLYGSSDPKMVYHGTGCAGISSAQTNNNTGVAGMAGGWGTNYPGIKIMAIRIDLTADLGPVIEYAVNNEAKVLSMSWGVGYTEILQAAFEDAFNNGCILVAASGNAVTSFYNLVFDVSVPAVCDNVIAVGATIKADTAWENSQYGPELDIMAPGGYEAGDIRNIYTTFSEVITSSNDYYAHFSGTSAACPHVSGLAALMIQANPNLTNIQVERILKWTADTVASGSLVLVNDDFVDNDYIDIDLGYVVDFTKVDENPHDVVLKPMYYGGDHWNYRYGYGRINAYNAVLAAQTTPAIPTAPVVPQYKFTTTKNYFGYSIKVKWDYLTGETRGYKLCYGTSSGSYPNSLDAGTKCYATINNLSYNNYYFGVKTYNYLGQESGFSNEGVMPSEWWYVEQQDSHEYGAFNYYYSSNADATLLFKVLKSYGDEWSAPQIRKDIADIVIPTDNSLTITWSQYDQAHSLYLGLLVQGVDNTDRWLTYGANAPNHWFEQGWVNMGLTNETYNQWIDFTRNVSLDFYYEYGIKAVKVKEMRLGHFVYSNWPEGDYGGAIKDVNISLKNWFQVAIQNQFIDVGNATNLGSVRINDVSYDSPYIAGWLYSSPSHTIKADSFYYIDDIGYYFCSWSDGLLQSHLVTPPDTFTYTSYYKTKPYLQGYYDGSSNVILTWDWALGTRPPYFTQFKLYQSSDLITPIYTGTNNYFYHSIYLAPTDVKSYYLTAYVYGLPSGYLMSNQLKVSGDVSDDPIVSETNSTEATIFSNGKKIAADNAGNVHVVYSSGDSVYYSLSTDNGVTWPSEKVFIGMGKYPALALNSKQVPTICWLNNNCLYGTKKEKNGFAKPYTVYTGPPEAILLSLSYVLNQNTNTAYLGWLEENSTGSVVKMSGYNPDTYALTSTAVIDNGEIGAFKSPSLAYDRFGNISVAWCRSGIIYYKDGSGQTELGQNGSNPNLDIYGDKTTVIWQEEILPGINQIVKKTKGPLGWSGKKIISYPDSLNADYPVVSVAGQYVYSKNVKDKDYDLIWNAEYQNGWLMSTQNMSSAQGGLSRYPSLAFKQGWPKSQLYIFWTEEMPDYETKAKKPPAKNYTVIIDPVPLLYVDAGTEESVVYTTRKKGVYYYGPHPDYTIDYDPLKLGYSFSGLNPLKDYLIKVTYYHESDTIITQTLAVDNTLNITSSIEPKTKATTESWISSNCLKDGKIEVTINKSSGAYAVCAVIALYEFDADYSKSTEDIADNSTTLLPSYSYELMQSYPNPTTGKASIKYQLAQPGKVSLKIYNTLGQVVKTLVSQDQAAGYYNVTWDGKDNAGKATANGVYFYRLESGDFKAIKKMVVIR